MAIIEITVPNNVAPRVGAAFVNYYNNEYTKLQQTNPNITAQQFVKIKMIEYLKKIVATWESNSAAQTAGRTALEKATNEVNPT